MNGLSMPRILLGLLVGQKQLQWRHTSTPYLTGQAVVEGQYVLWPQVITYGKHKIFKLYISLEHYVVADTDLRPWKKAIFFSKEIGRFHEKTG